MEGMKQSYLYAIEQISKISKYAIECITPNNLVWKLINLSLALYLFYGNNSFLFPLINPNVSPNVGGMEVLSGKWQITLIE